VSAVDARVPVGVVREVQAGRYGARGAGDIEAAGGPAPPVAESGTAVYSARAVLHSIRQSLPPRASALLGVVAILCGLGLEVHAATMGHHEGDAAPDAVATPAASAHGQHDDCADAAGDGAAATMLFTVCCHTAACTGGGIALPVQRAVPSPPVHHALAMFGDPAGLSGLRPTPPLRPPRPTSLPL